MSVGASRAGQEGGAEGDERRRDSAAQASAMPCRQPRAATSCASCAGPIELAACCCTSFPSHSVTPPLRAAFCHAAQL